MRKLIIFIVLLLVLLGLWNTAKVYVPQLSSIGNNASSPILSGEEKVTMVTEESVTINAVKNVGPSVVTVALVGGSAEQTSPLDLGPFGIFNQPDQQQDDSLEPHDIGSGFIVTTEGFIVTNKHVVAESTAKYQIITASDKKYDVEKIYRDPLNDVAILKINPKQNVGTILKPVVLGDSSHLQVGQFVIAIGTALGEFRNSVTTGVISGLGRGITAGDQFQGYVEKLDNVIQTNAAINPGNSGGPLLNSSGQVIGVNTAVAQSGQNIGFALPVNVIKDSLSNFNKTGQFNRPYLGVRYKIITQSVALLNNVPQGGYVQGVEANSPARIAGIQQGDIIVKIDNTRIGEKENALTTIVSHKKVGDRIKVTVWRDNKTIDVTVTLEAAPNQ